MHIVILSKTEYTDLDTKTTTVENVLSFDSEAAATRWATEITEAVEWSSCVVTQTSEAFEVFWNKYRHIKKVERLLKDWTGKQAQEVWDFTNPYVCCIHEPTKRGFYLCRNYRYICSVENIIRPGDPMNEKYVPYNLKRLVIHETEYQHRVATFMTPQWAEELPPKEFTTYWLY